MAKEDLSDNDRMLAALSHFFVLIPPGVLGPIAMIFLCGNQPFVRYHAIQATLFQIVGSFILATVITFTCGVGIVLIPVWIGAELYFAWRAFEGHWDGYPGVASIGRPALDS